MLGFADKATKSEATEMASGPRIVHFQEEEIHLGAEPLILVCDGTALAQVHSDAHIRVYLPLISDCPDAEYTIKNKAGMNAAGGKRVEIACSGSDTIEGENRYSIKSVWGTLTIRADAKNTWLILFRD